MGNRIQYCTALFLLVMSSAAFSAQMGSMFCRDDSRASAPATAASVAVEATTMSVAVECPLATMAEFVAAPMMMSFAPLFSVLRPAYVAALYWTPRYWVDPEPPTKPPSA